MISNQLLTSSSIRKCAPLRDFVLPTRNSDPRRAPDSQFTYIDVSAITSETLSIETPSVLCGADAPSRARKQVRTGDVLFATIRPSLRRVALVPEQLDGAICSTAFTVLRANPEFLDPQYLYYNVLSEDFVDRVSELQRGSSYPAVSDGDVLNQLVSLPPLVEQCRIARILSTIKQARRCCTRSVGRVEELRRSITARLFTPNNEWLTVRLGDQITLQRGHDLPSQDREPGSVPVVSSSGITGWHSSSKAQGPGVVIGRYGTLGVVQFLEVPYWPLNTTLYVRDFHGNEPRFVRYFLETVSYDVHNDKTSVPGVNRNDLHALQIMWPPLADQQRIAATLDVVERRLANEEAVGAALDGVFSSALSHLMTGAS